MIRFSVLQLQPNWTDPRALDLTALHWQVLGPGVGACSQCVIVQQSDGFYQYLHFERRYIAQISFFLYLFLRANHILQQLIKLSSCKTRLNFVEVIVTQLSFFVQNWFHMCFNLLKQIGRACLGCLGCNLKRVFKVQPTCNYFRHTKLHQNRPIHLTAIAGMQEILSLSSYYQ